MSFFLLTQSTRLQTLKQRARPSPGPLPREVLKAQRRMSKALLEVQARQASSLERLTALAVAASEGRG